MTADGVAPDRSDRVGIVRLIVGLLQGLALYLLFESEQSKTWPSTDGPLFVALGTTAIFAPLIIVASLSYLRLAQLVVWTDVVVLICGGLGWYDIVRDPLANTTFTPRTHPSLPFVVAFGAGLFIAHCLVVAAIADRRLIAHYSTYFDVSWKYGVQAALGIAFTGVFWLLLWLGASLFELIKISVLAKLLHKPWFAIPATTLAFTCAIHLTDVRVGIVRGVRTLSCTLLSWLLPLMTLLAVGFVATLPFTGLEPLWSTRRASAILIAAAASLIFLINTAYQDGAQADGSARQIPQFLRLSMAAASAALIPICLLASYGIALRIEQHGWTSDRVIAAACTVVALCYAVGYLAASIRWNAVFSWLETTNIATSFVILAILLSLLTPIADPARISVADQIRRLNAGLIAPEQFDYAFLRFGAGRYGNEALQRLAEQKTFPVAAERSAATLQKKTRYEARSLVRLTGDQRAANLTVVFPKGTSLPREFLDIDWSENRRSYLVPSCLKISGRCEVIVADLDGDGTDEIIALPRTLPSAQVFRANRDGAWDYFGELAGVGCPGVREALLAGNLSIAATTAKEIEVAGRRLRMNWPPDCAANLTQSIRIQPK